MYRLKKYYLRSLLTFTGPLLALAFYLSICLTYLRNPPVNGIVNSYPISARGIQFTWITAAIFMLDLSKTGLANIEAAALMDPRLAPLNATRLMWHTDGKWANPLWWLRACKSMISVLLRRKGSYPGFLWCILSLASLMIYIGLPLSGLSVELANVLTPSASKALIYGPSAATFNLRSTLGFPQQIRSRWSTGRSTIPPTGAILYAPQGTTNVNETYFSDQAAIFASSIEVFAGPAVHESVSGQAWGVYANISCNPVPKSRLQALSISNLTGFVNGCVFNWRNESCELEWFDNTTRLAFNVNDQKAFPLVINEPGVIQQATLFKYLAVADGAFLGGYGFSSPFEQISNHDSLTYDSISGKRSQEEVTTALFEMYFWQSDAYNLDAPNEIMEGGYDDPIDIYEYLYWKGPKHYHATMMGIGIHCDVRTEVGSADLHPDTRTFSSFQRNRSLANSEIHTPGIEDTAFIYPPQVLALAALSSLASYNTSEGHILGSLEPQQNEMPWVDLHRAINSPAGAYPDAQQSLDDGVAIYKALRPKDLQVAIYKLLGESVISMMDEGGLTPWYGELRELEGNRYIVRGIVPWPYALAFLSIWALIVCAGALWTLVLAEPRWATSLGGFEMFKFGASYSDEMEDLTDVDFRACNDVLQRIPGMVGMLSGTGALGDTKRNIGFVGLSENVASKSCDYTFRRKEADTVRPM